jgi:CheY-like chemotaxis protein
MTVLTAGTGKRSDRHAGIDPDVAIVLMDIMMPEMDGYETMQVIRQNASFSSACPSLRSRQRR